MSHKRRRPLAEALPPPIALLRESSEICRRPEQRADDPSTKISTKICESEMMSIEHIKGAVPKNSYH